MRIAKCIGSSPIATSEGKINLAALNIRLGASEYINLTFEQSRSSKDSFTAFVKLS